MRRAAPVLLLLGAACGVSTEQGKQMDDRIRRIEVAESSTAGQLDQQRAVLRERIASVDLKLGEVQQKLDELNATASRTGADVAASQDRLTDRVKKLQGTVEDQQRRIDDLEATIATLRAEGVSRGTSPRVVAPVPVPRAPQGTSEQAVVFAKAQEQEAAGKKVVASELYAEVVRKWPGDSLAAESQFRLGEIAYGEKRYADAMTAYGRVAESYPKSDKAPDALLRTAESMTALGMKDDARAIYEAVGARYPRSAAAKKSAARLRELYPKGAKG